MAEKYTTAQMVAALEATKGMVYLAAKQLGCSHTTIYNYIERHPTVKEAWEAQGGEVGDTAELKLYQAILEGQAWAVAFYLKTKGKSRGYTERQELEHSGPNGGPIVIDGTTREEAGKELAEWRKQQIESLSSGQNASQMPPILPTST